MFRALHVIVFSILACAAGVTPSLAQIVTLYNFGGPGTVGTEPEAGLVMDSKGNLYGTTACVGNSTCYYSGVAFEVSPVPGGGWRETLLYAFGDGSTTAAADPGGGLVLDSAGNLYGTTVTGGANGAGTVFELSPATSGVWTEKILYSFGGADGAFGPIANLVFDAAGNLYGVANSGGTNGGGVVFELSPAGNGAWTETNLYQFGAALNDGTQPNATLVFDSSGRLYGTTEYGGANGAGIVFQLVHSGSGNTWTENILYSFGQNSIDGPLGGTIGATGLILDAKGNLYGMTAYGGPNPNPGVDVGPGFVYELSPNTDGTWTETIIHTFNFTGDGNWPEAALLIDASGNLYGTTVHGGNPGAGTVFRLSPESNGEWAETILANLGPFNQTNPEVPGGAVIMDATGNLYTTASDGGAYFTCVTYVGNAGAVIEIPAGQPIFTPAPGGYLTTQSVTLTAPIQGSAIYYTLDGTTPTAASTRYTNPIPVAASATINAIAIPAGKSPSGVSTGRYTINPHVLPPVFSPPPGIYAAPLNVTITSPTPCGSIFYTTDGTQPRDNVNPFMTPIPVSATETINAIGSELNFGFLDSPPVAATYIIEAPSYVAGQVTLPSVLIGNATYTNMVVTIEGIVSGPSGASANAIISSYDPSTGQLSVPVVTVGGTTYYNVVGKVKSLISIGGVTRADVYDGTNLSIPFVQAGAATYDNAVVTQVHLISVAGGMPATTVDQYDTNTKQLVIPAVQYNGKVYTNVRVTVGRVVSVNGTPL